MFSQSSLVWGIGCEACFSARATWSSSFLIDTPLYHRPSFLLASIMLSWNLPISNFSLPSQSQAVKLYEFSKTNSSCQTLTHHLSCLVYFLLPDKSRVVVPNHGPTSSAPFLPFPKKSLHRGQIMLALDVLIGLAKNRVSKSLYFHSSAPFDLISGWLL